MKKGILIFISTFFLSASRAAERQIEKQILVTVPAVSEQTYQEMLKMRGDLESPVEAEIQSYVRRDARPAVFEAADLCLQKQNCDVSDKDFEKVRAQTLITPKERELLLEIWQKAGKPLDCYWHKDRRCTFQKINIEKLGLSTDQSYAIFIDGVIYKNGDVIELLPHRKYQWRIISNRHQAKSAWATSDEVQNQISLNNPYVTGGCLASAAQPGVDPDLRTKMWVAFDRTCVRKIDEPFLKQPEEQAPGWISRNKAWLIPVLALTAGGAYYLRDKDIEFTNPFR